MPEPKKESPLRFRPRRLRIHPVLRDLVAETTVGANDLIYPVFVREGKGIRKEISSMPGIFQHSPDLLVDELKEAEQAGVKAFIIFGIEEERKKNASGSSSLLSSGLVPTTLAKIKRSGIKMLAVSDVCLCEYTAHGHCGILSSHSHETVDNDRTLPLLGKQAVIHANSGADLIAPSGMMDGGVAVIRNALDQQGFKNIPIMSYAVKYASAFYGPFREAAESAPKFGDRRSYQMDFRRRDEAILEARLDVEQGADLIMVKPGLPCLDIVRDVRNAIQVPVAAYQVSGEYAMIKAAAQNKWIQEIPMIMETLHAFKRAGASLILTYFAKQIASNLK